MLNIKEILDKKDYVINRLKDDITKEEYELRHSLVSLASLEMEKKDYLNSKLNNGLTQDEITIQKFKEFKEILETTPQNEINIDDDYLYYLLQIAVNVFKMDVNYKKDEFESLNISEEEKVKLSREFYKSLGNKEIFNNANKILNDPSHYEFVDEITTRNSLGFTAYDRIFNKPYMIIKKSNDLVECQAFNHEVMHGIDYYIKPYKAKDDYVYYNEIITHTIDYLFFDFLEEKGYDKNQINVLRRKKYYFTKYVSGNIQMEISLRLNKLREIIFFNENNIKDIKKVIDKRLLVELFHLESFVIAYGLYKQIKDNKEKGLSNLNKLLTNKIPNNLNTDFSFIDLDRKTIIELSKELGNMNNEIINNNKFRR